MGNKRLLFNMGANGQIDDVLYCIARGDDVNEKSPLGYPPLWEAVRNNRRDIIAVLVANGAELDCACDNITALALACNYSNVETVALLLELGADMDLVTNGRNAESFIGGPNSDQLHQLFAALRAKLSVGKVLQDAGCQAKGAAS